MVVRENNIDKVPENEQGLLRALLKDLANINSYGKLELDIHWQDWHNEYSSERTDPCPDFYGAYTLRVRNSFETVGIGMTLDELDTNMCTLINYLEYACNK